MPVDEAQFVMEIRGSQGSIQLTGNHPAGPQVGDLTLTASVDFEAPEPAVAQGAYGPAAAEIWNGAAINVGELYRFLARDIIDGTSNSFGFDRALHNSRLIAAVERAAETGQRQSQFNQ